MEKEKRRTMKIGEKKQVTISAWKRTELTYLGKFNGKPRYESQTKHIAG
jgi:hypothetical protein